jgi:hypothetical protein
VIAYSLALLEARTGVAVATAGSAVRPVTGPVRDRQRHLASAGAAASAAAASAAVASAGAWEGPPEQPGILGALLVDLS